MRFLSSQLPLFERYASHSALLYFFCYSMNHFYVFLNGSDELEGEKKRGTQQTCREKYK